MINLPQDVVITIGLDGFMEEKRTVYQWLLAVMAKCLEVMCLWISLSRSGMSLRTSC